MDKRLICLDIDGVLIPNSERPYDLAIDDVKGAASLFNPGAVLRLRNLAQRYRAQIACTSSWVQGSQPPEYFRQVFERARFGALALDMLVPEDFEMGSHMIQVADWLEQLDRDPNRVLWIDDDYLYADERVPGRNKWIARLYRPRFGVFTDLDLALASTHMGYETGAGGFVAEHRARP